MGNKKKSDGVIATIERLTGQVPCPVFLRNSLNKYLYEPALFDGANKGSANKDKVQGKLIQGDTDALVMNVLNLDQVFNGATTAVVRIASGEVGKKELEDMLDQADAELQRRFDAYGYWVQRMGQLKKILGDGDIDLKKVRLDQLIKTPSEVSVSNPQNPFALRAFQQLERIEEKGRLGALSSRELTEQADAYFALGNYAKAAEKAASAVEADPKNAQAWFIRVMVALRRRNAALRKTQLHMFNATELAESMSSHETMELELAEEASNEVSGHNDVLTNVLPQALLNWPRVGKRFFFYEHTDEWRVVRDLFVDSVFSKVSGQRGGSHHLALLGSCAGWLPPRVRDVWRKDRDETGGAATAFVTESELQAIKLLLEERDDTEGYWLDLLSKTEVGLEFKLLHLRWALRLDGYQTHWQQFKGRIERHQTVEFERNILSSDWLTRLWQLHVMQNEGVEGVVVLMDQWYAKTIEERRSVSNSSGVKQCGLLFHDCLARGEYERCVDIARHAQEFCEEATDRVTYTGHGMDSPDDESIWMPVDSRLYWKYLEVIAVMQMPLSSCAGHGLPLLSDAEHLATKFQDVNKCFWRQIDCDESAGEYEIPPYDIDLRDARVWLMAAKSYVEAPSAPKDVETLYPVMQRLLFSERRFGRGCLSFFEGDTGKEFDD